MIDTEIELILGGSLILAAIAIGKYLYKLKQKKKRTEQLKAFAEEIGFSFSTTKRRTFSTVQSIYVMERSTHDMTVHISVHYEYNSLGEKNKYRIRRTIMSFTGRPLNFPAFQLHPKQNSIWEKILGESSHSFYRDIELKPHSVFSNRYSLRGNNETKIRSLFNRRVISFYEYNWGLFTKANGNFFEISSENAGRSYSSFDEVCSSIQQGFRAFNVFSDLRLIDLDLLPEVALAFGEIQDIYAVESLTEALRHPNQRVRWQAAAVLTKQGTIHAVEPLIHALEDTDQDVRWQVVVALGKIGDVRAVEPLLKTLKYEHKTLIREDMILALGKIGDVRAVEPLMKMFSSEDVTIQSKAAAEALEKIGEACGAVEPLIEAIEHGSEYTREKAATALIKIGLPAAQSLLRLLKHQDAAVRLQGTNVLNGMNWKPESKLEKAYYLLAAQKWGNFLSWGAPAIEPLTKVLEEIQFEEATVTLHRIYASITMIGFGKSRSDRFDQKSTLYNPDVSALTMSMPALESIEVDVETYDFHQVERFLTYAVNYIGQKHLKKNVEVHIYGDQEKLHPNLWNNFTNLCKDVQVYRA